MQQQWTKCFINWLVEQKEENELLNGTQIEQIVKISYDLSAQILMIMIICVP